MAPGLEVIEIQFILRLKIKHNDWLVADTCPPAANHCAFFESETVIKFYNLGACRRIHKNTRKQTVAHKSMNSISN